jgi:L-iditol 2-dehydrogenase
VLLTDISTFKLEKARACGFDHVVNTQTNSLGNAIASAFGPDRADVILECVGAEQTLTQAVANARKGSTIVVVGGFGTKPVFDIAVVQDRELTLHGTLMYQKRDVEQAIRLAAGGHLLLDPLITHRFAFNEYPVAYSTIDSAHGRTMKVLLEL